MAALHYSWSKDREAAEVPWSEGREAAEVSWSEGHEAAGVSWSDGREAAGREAAEVSEQSTDSWEKTPEPVEEGQWVQPATVQGWNSSDWHQHAAQDAETGGSWDSSSRQPQARTGGGWKSWSWQQQAKTGGGWDSWSWQLSAKTGGGWDSWSWQPHGWNSWSQAASPLPELPPLPYPLEESGGNGLRGAPPAPPSTAAAAPLLSPPSRSPGVGLRGAPPAPPSTAVVLFDEVVEVRDGWVREVAAQVPGINGVVWVPWTSEAERNWYTIKNDDIFCLMCDQFAQSKHLLSKRHEKRRQPYSGHPAAFLNMPRCPMPRVGQVGSWGDGGRYYQWIGDADHAEDGDPPPPPPGPPVGQAAGMPPPPPFYQ